MNNSIFRHTRIKNIMTNDRWVFFLQKEYGLFFLLGDFLKYSPNLKTATTRWKFSQNNHYNKKFKISNNFLLKNSEKYCEDYEELILFTERVFINIL